MGCCRRGCDQTAWLLDSSLIIEDHAGWQVPCRSVGLGHSPLLLAVPVAIAASAAFMLPVATPPNAIVFGYPGIRVATMAKSGVVLNLLAIVVITSLVLLLGGPVLGMGR